MKPVFLDTRGWANLFVRTEPFHQRAVELVKAARQERGRVVSGNYVLAELSALLMSPIRVPREARLQILSRIREASWVEIVHVVQAQDAASWEYLTSRKDKDYSLVDCSSFVIMQREGMNESLTADIHFEQAGFIRLLK